MKLKIKSEINHTKGLKLKIRTDDDTWTYNETSRGRRRAEGSRQLDRISRSETGYTICALAILLFTDMSAFIHIVTKY